MQLYRLTSPPKEGDEVQFVGVYVLKWRDVIAGKIREPTVAFTEATDEEINREYERIFGHPH